MKIIKKFIGNFMLKEEVKQRPEPESKLYDSLEKNIEYLKNKFKGSADFTIRNLSMGEVRAALFTIEGMVDKENLAISILNPLMKQEYTPMLGIELVNFIERSVLYATDIVYATTFEKALSFMMSGFAVLAVDGCNEMLAVGVQGFTTRGISEPETEIVQKGSREGFVEPLQINMSLVRRRIKNTFLRFETRNIGKTSKTQICLCYLADRVSMNILKELKNRLDKVDIDVLLAAGYLVPYLEDDGGRSVFSGVGSSERPDTICGKINEGRIAIIIDGTPAVLVVPFLFVEKFQTMDDYSNRPYFATFTRWLKYMAFFVAMLTPGIYVALATFNAEVFPVEILTRVVSSVSSTPFTLMVEVLIIHFIYEIMREAGLRLPKALGHAVSIMGALIIGETAVNAGLIGAPTLMVVALTAVSSYVIPTLYPPLAVLRLLFIIAGGTFGIWGVVLLFCVVLVNIFAKTSFGIPFATPIAPFNLFGMRDVFVRANWRVLSKKRNLVQNQVTGSNDIEEENK